jgi:hypothetical protein
MSLVLDEISIANQSKIHDLSQLKNTDDVLQFIEKLLAKSSQVNSKKKLNKFNKFKKFNKF